MRTAVDEQKRRDEKEKAVAKVDELQRMREQAEDEDGFAGTVGPDGGGSAERDGGSTDRAGGQDRAQIVLEAAPRRRKGRGTRRTNDGRRVLLRKSGTVWRKS